MSVLCAQILLLTDLLYADVQREFVLRSGVTRERLLQDKENADKAKLEKSQKVAPSANAKERSAPPVAPHFMPRLVQFSSSLSKN